MTKLKSKVNAHAKIMGHFTLATTKHLSQSVWTYFDPLISSKKSLDGQLQTQVIMHWLQPQLPNSNSQRCFFSLQKGQGQIYMSKGGIIKLIGRQEKVILTSTSW